MLLHGSKSILEVAIATGFTSGSHFTRRYRALFGHTPRAERKR
jgi:transcriptional regulator GlxA family with amidase domain